MSDILGVDDDRERSPLHENRDTVLDMENRDRFKPRVRRSGVKQQGPLVRFVYLVRCTDSFYWNWVKRISRKNRFKKNILKPINCIFLLMMLIQQSQYYEYLQYKLCSLYSYLVVLSYFNKLLIHLRSQPTS